MMTQVCERQDPLRERYQVAPEDATITDRARTTGGIGTDPFHGAVVPGSEDYGVEWPFGIHRAVGGIMTPRILEMCCALPSPPAWTRPFACSPTDSVVIW